MVGKVVGNCKITEKIGVGGFGTVYKGIQTSLNREVAVKVLHPQFTEVTGFVERFQAEAKILATLSHNNIVQVYDIVQEENTYFIIMEYVKGQTMKETLAQQKKLPLDQALRAAQDVARALAYTHKKNIVHRDIKPANIIFTEEGVVKVTDFGIAKVLTDASQSFTRVGSLSYSSPEQITGEPVDARTDIYALGVTLYQMLTGELPPSAGTAPSLKAAGITVPLALERAVTKALQKKKEDRYTTMELFLKDLEKVSVNAAKNIEKDETVFSPGEETILAGDKDKAGLEDKPLVNFAGKFKKPVWLFSAAVFILALTVISVLVRRSPAPDAPLSKEGVKTPVEKTTSAAEPHSETSGVIIAGPAVAEKTGVSQREKELSEQYYRSGLEHTGKEEWIEAVKDFEEALKYNNENSPAQYELGFAYSQLSERGEEARMHMERAVELNPRNVIYRYSLGLVYINAGDTAKAVQIWEKAREIDPQNPTIEAVLKKYKK